MPGSKSFYTICYHTEYSFWNQHENLQPNLAPSALCCIPAVKLEVFCPFTCTSTHPVVWAPRFYTTCFTELLWASELVWRCTTYRAFCTAFFSLMSLVSSHAPVRPVVRSMHRIRFYTICYDTGFVRPGTAGHCLKYTTILFYQPSSSYLPLFIYLYVRPSVRYWDPRHSAICLDTEFSCDPEPAQLIAAQFLPSCFFVHPHPSSVMSSSSIRPLRPGTQSILGSRRMPSTRHCFLVRPGTSEGITANLAYIRCPISFSRVFVTAPVS
jgi:hypothetical protein